MLSSRAFMEVREVVGDSVSEATIKKALKEHAYSTPSAINYIVDLTMNKQAAAGFRSERKGDVEVVELLDDEDTMPMLVNVEKPSIVQSGSSSSKRFRESPPAEVSHPLAAPSQLERSSTATPRPRSLEEIEEDIRNTSWPKLLGRRSVDAESTYRGKPPPEMVPGAELIVKRMSGVSQRNHIVRLATTKGTEVGRLPSELGEIIAPLIDAECIRCSAKVEFLPDRLEIFTRFCVTVEIYVKSWRSFECFTYAQQNEKSNSTEDGESNPKAKKKTPSFAANAAKSNIDFEDLSDRFWKAIQLSFGSLTVEGVYKERLSKGTISLLEDDYRNEAASPGADEKELSEEELFGGGKDLDLAKPTESDDSPVNSGLTVNLRVHQRVAINWMRRREMGLAPSKTTASSVSHHPLWMEVKFEDGWPFYLNRFTRMAQLIPPPNVSHLCKGGILADEMGLGKTIVVLGRITQEINDGELAKSTPAAETDGENEKECGTLVVVVTSLLSQWESEIDTKINESQKGMHRGFSRFTYYGSDRESDSRLRSADIVLTTFGVVASDFKSKNKTLFDIKWRRVVLDEAQSVRNGDTLQAKAVLDLRADRRWCLTGTPVQNGIDDLFQLFRFIHLEPWGQRLWWDRVIEKPYKAGDPAALQRIRGVLADGPVLLRRTHKSVEELEGVSAEASAANALPKLTTEIVEVELTETERNFYDSLYSRSKLEFEGMIASGKAATSYVTILSLLIRLRQAADHPYLVLGRPKSDKEEARRRDDEYIRRIAAKHFNSGETASVEFARRAIYELSKGGDCTICLCAMVEPVILRCAHTFCRKCVTALDGNFHGGSQCPICREPFERGDLVDIRLPSRENQITFKDGTQVSDASELLGAHFRMSSKLDRLVKEISLRRENNNGNDKFLIFSQFTQMLDLCEVALSKMDPPVQFQRLDGTMSSSKRDTALKKFKDDPKTEAMLMSLKAGCLGLNITCANVVVLLDPWWNAAVEHQAIGRAHRMGQTRQVTVLRFIAKDTVEVKMLNVQEKKASVASDALGFEQFADDDEGKAASKLTLDDLKEFFS